MPRGPLRRASPFIHRRIPRSRPWNVVLHGCACLATTLLTARRSCEGLLSRTGRTLCRMLMPRTTAALGHICLLCFVCTTVVVRVWRFLPPFFFCGCWCIFFFTAPLYVHRREEIANRRFAKLRPGFESGGIAVVATKSRGPRHVQGAVGWKEANSVLFFSFYHGDQTTWRTLWGICCIWRSISIKYVQIKRRRELWPRKWFFWVKIRDAKHVDRCRGRSILVWLHQLTSDLKRCLLFWKCLHWSCLKAVRSVSTCVIGGLRGSTATSGSCLHTSWCPKFNGSRFRLPTSSLHRYTGGVVILCEWWPLHTGPKARTLLL